VANFMMVRSGVVITPPVTANILEGIVRRSLITLIREELGVEVIEREIDRTELYLAEEAFFCGTGAQIAAIGSIDHRIIGQGGTGPVIHRLRELFYRVLRGEEAKYVDWLSPVPVQE
jgi:branched-chain amino acid aminotransferase